MVLSLPAMVLIAIGLDAYRALIISQVILSLQLPFTIIPLLWLSRVPAGDGGGAHGYRHDGDRRRSWRR